MAKMKDHFAAIVDNEFEARSRKLMVEDLERSDLDQTDLKCYPLKTPPLPMFHPEWVLAAYRIPYFNRNGEQLESMYRDRLFYRPQVTEADLKQAGMGKYKQPSGHITTAANIRGNYPYLPAGGEGSVLVLCEGEKKAISALKRFKCPVIGVGGANSWRAEKGSDALHPEIVLRITDLSPSRIILAVDPDIKTNKNVNAGWAGLRNRIVMLFPEVPIEIIVLEDKLDDYLLKNRAFGLEDFLDVEGLPEVDLNMSVKDLANHFSLMFAESARGVVSLLNNVYNVGTLIRNHPFWKGAIKQNSDSGLIEIFGEPYNELHHPEKICNELNSKLHMKQTGIRSVRDAMLSIACENAYSPTALEIMEAGVWDGTRRIKDLFGKDRSEADISVAEAFVYGYVNRVLNPGCFWRNMVILVGKQGVGKTGMARWLAGPHGSVASVNPGDLKNINKDTKLKILRSNVALFDDIETFGHGDQGQLKSLVTMTDDTIRDVYARSPMKYLRRGIMMGTSNQKEILPSDPTGQTRYGVVELSVMQDWEWLDDNRAQILAEARHMVENGKVPTIAYGEMDQYVEKGELEERCEEFAQMVIDNDDMVKGGVLVSPTGRKFFKASLFWLWYKKQNYTPKDWERKEVGARLRKLGFKYHTNNVARIDGKNLKHVFELPAGVSEGQG